MPSHGRLCFLPGLKLKKTSALCKDKVVGMQPFCRPDLANYEKLICVVVSIVGQRLFFAAGTYTYDGGNANVFGAKITMASFTSENIDID